MRILQILVLSLMLNACAKVETKYVDIKDEEVRSIFNEFYNEAYSRGVYVDIEALKIKLVDDNEFAKTSDKGADSEASCSRNAQYRVDYRGVKAYFEKKIVIKKSSWLNHNKITKKKILFHELGHCTLNQDHRIKLNSFGINNNEVSESIMTPGHLPVEYSDQKIFTEGNWQQLLDEMFYYNAR